MVSKVYLTDSRYSKLMEEWDWSENTKHGYDPSNLTHGSHKKVYWKCPEGHNYVSPIHNKVKGTGCPYCTGKLAIVGVNDLRTIRPDIYQEAVSKDSVDGVLPQSNRKVEWECKENHKYVSQISRRFLGQGCPFCSNQRVLLGFNDIKTTHPEVVRTLLHPDKAIELTYGSDRLVEWVCESKHVWVATVKSRVSGTGCPKCSKVVSGPELVLLGLFEEYGPISQFKTKDFSFIPDIYVPDLNLIVEYDGSYYHNNLISKDLLKTSELLGRGYLVCRIREDSLPHLELSHPNLLQISVKYTKNLSNLDKEFVETIISWSKQRDIIIT